MAVCNLFNKLNNTSGNFMMFSQYVEDITHNYVEGNKKVVPTKFIALDIDYSKVNKDYVYPNGENLNTALPKFFQNSFENGCAWGRKNYEGWTPECSRNLFWNMLFESEMLHSSEYGATDIVDEIMYYGNINMHSYNEHQGMGYGEIYCYIPTDASKMNCQVIYNFTDDKIEITPDKNNVDHMMYLGYGKLEGHGDQYINNYKQKYLFNKDYSMPFDDDTVSGLLNSSNITKYNINTIIVLYDVFERQNDDWVTLYNSIPMGVYVAGVFDDNDKLSNNITKYVSTSYNTGTAYGLRICTRFTAVPNGPILYNSDIIADDSNYTNICQLMTAMNENLYKMLEVTKSTIDTAQSYKETLATIKNSRTNVPYVKNVNGVDCWFVNGRFVSSVGDGSNGDCEYISNAVVKERLRNLSDSDEYNDYTYIPDPINPDNCLPTTAQEVAKFVWPDNDKKWDEYPNCLYTDSSDFTKPDTSVYVTKATNAEVGAKLESDDPLEEYPEDTDTEYKATISTVLDDIGELVNND